MKSLFFIPFNINFSLVKLKLLYYLIFLSFIFVNSLSATEKICSYLLYENFFSDEYANTVTDYGFFIESENNNDDNNLDIISIYPHSPAFSAGIDIQKDPILKSINGQNLELESIEDYSRVIEIVNSFLDENSIKVEIYYPDDNKTEIYELEKYEYEKDFEVQFNVKPKSLSVINRSKETQGLFDITLYWDIPPLMSEIEQINDIYDYVCYFDTQDTIEQVLNKIWTPIPSDFEFGSRYEITKYYDLRVRNMNADDYNFELNFEMAKTVINESDIYKFPFDVITNYFDFAFYNGGDLYSGYLINNETIKKLNKTLFEWQILNIDEYYKQVQNGEVDAHYIEFEIARKSIYYIFKIMIPVIFIVLISFSVFWINNQQLEAKLNVSIVSLLALIAYNFVYAADLPKVSDITVLDTFILIAYLFAGLSTFVSVYSYFDYRNDKLVGDFNRLDKTMRYAAPICYFLLTTVSCILVYYH